MGHRVPEKTLTPASLPMAMLKIGLWEDDVCRAVTKPSTGASAGC